MGKYSNVNASSLLNATVTAINELSSHNLSIEYNSLKNRSTLTSQASKLVCNSLDDIINSKSIAGSIPKLKEKLNNLKKAVEAILKCQELEKEIKNLESKLYDSKGNKDMLVQWQIDSKKSSLSNYETKVDNLLN